MPKPGTLPLEQGCACLSGKEKPGPSFDVDQAQGLTKAISHPESWPAPIRIQPMAWKKTLDRGIDHFKNKGP